jgi:hypothetical protein
MRIPRHVPALLVLLVLAACGDGLGPDALTGGWLHRTEAPSSAADWWRSDLRLELRGDGSYTWGATTHADWGRPGDKLLGYSREHGRYEVAGDSLFLQPGHVEWWDYLTGGPHEEDVSGRPAGRFRARIVNRHLVLSYVSFPADAPEETQMVLRRD